MKIKSILGGAALALALVTSAQADVTVNITGATAFRAATLNTIKAQFVASGVAFKFAHDKATSGGSTFNGSTRSIWIGKFPGVTGTTTIRCCFTGSVEGVRALLPTVTDPSPPTYYQSSLLTGTTAAVGGTELANQGTTGVAALGSISDIAFSDVQIASTPYKGKTLSPGSPQAGAILFTMVASNNTRINSITAQQFAGIMNNGFLPLTAFKGSLTDTGAVASNELVVATGRNDGSGTRTTYLAETGFGISNPVQQYVLTGSSGNFLTSIQLVPAGGVGISTKYASTVWGQDQDGNGGYDSGGGVATALSLSGAGSAGTGITVNDATGSDAFGSAQIVTLVTWLGLADAKTAITTTPGAKLIGYNGVKLNGFDGTEAGSTVGVLSATDLAKLYNGAYTAWGYENMFYRNDASTDVQAVYATIKSNLDLSSTTGTLPLDSNWKVGRQTDGGLVGPK